MEVGTVELLLQFIYGCLHQPDLTLPEVAALFQASDKYALASLHQQCARLLTSHISYDNIFQLADLAQLHQCPSLLQVSHAVACYYTYVYLHILGSYVVVMLWLCCGRWSYVVVMLWSGVLWLPGQALPQLQKMLHGQRALCLLNDEI